MVLRDKDRDRPSPGSLDRELSSGSLVLMVELLIVLRAEMAQARVTAIVERLNVIEFVGLCLVASVIYTAIHPLAL